MGQLHFKSAVEIARLIREREVRATEALEHFLARVEKYNPKLNAVIWLDVGRARERAKAADAALAKGEVWGPLHGVPMTIKESYNVAGSPTTWGDPKLANNVTETSALAAERLEKAGAVLFGKTNVPLMLADWQSYNAIYGTTNNPWDVTRTPGGSSGGSAAALAAGLTGLEAGSDIGGSIRNPAHYCGVFGLKPTWGVVSPKGQALPGRLHQTDISVIGPMARGADDLEIALGVMAGPDEVDAAGYKLALAAPRQKALRDFKLAVMLTDPNAEVDTEVQEKIQAVADFLAKQRAKVSDRARPDIDTNEAARVYIHLLRAATAGRQSQEDFDKTAAVARSLPAGDDSYYARMVRGTTSSHRDWLVANEARQKMRFKWAEFFKEYDLLLCPAASSAAFPHDHVGERHERTIEINGRRVPTTDQLFWAGYPGMAYLPGTVAPAGRTKAGLPVGIQIVGPQYGDRTCIQMARLLEREYQGFVPPPTYV